MKELRSIRLSIIDFIFIHIFRTRWVVNSSGEFGVRVCGVNMWYYKDSTPIVGISDDNDYYREVNNREFKEVITSSVKS